MAREYPDVGRGLPPPVYLVAQSGRPRVKGRGFEGHLSLGFVWLSRVQ